MKRVLLIFCAILISTLAFPQQNSAFQDGEWFKFRMSYSNFFKAGNATLEVKEKTLDGRQVYHVVGRGYTTGPVKLFFKVKDRYESYIDRRTGLPYKFIRNIDEGGHTKDIEIKFDHNNRKAYVENKKHKTNKAYATEKDVQDMVSAFYYLRNNYSTENIKEGDVVKLNMFFDEENFNFQLKFLERETITTDFGDIKTLKFRPYVMAGRVFKEQESLTLWISADENRLPLRIKADLAVGSLRADLEAFKGLKYSFVKEFD
ncbi:Protein of unknown function [Flavobacteriaceae bacterium MAR_2010_188]|nr:Protein of unknown function [Flavobacteriaceae bacterium MAR_2010_188]